MEKTKTSVTANGLIWFGAAVSIAEILTGTCLAPLGFGCGAAAILLGHLIGCALLYLAGMIGARTQQSAMETVKLSFGARGAGVFAVLNVWQLVGWTAVMTVSGAAAAETVCPLGGTGLWAAVIGALIALWLLAGLKNLGRLSAAAVGALLLLTVMLSAVVFRGGGTAAAAGGMSFGAAVELSAAMPISWLPLIADYTRAAKRPRAATLASAGAYFFVSCWMYMIGLGAALYTGESDIAKIFVSAGLGTAGLAIILLSTVTTTFLDVYSAGVSAASLHPGIREKGAGLAACALGTLLAILAPVSQFENFLYLIGSVFAPMIAILITDYFILKRDSSTRAFDWRNLALWLAGFVLYRVFMGLDTPVGSTLPVMLALMAGCVAVDKIQGGRKNAGKMS